MTSPAAPTQQSGINTLGYRERYGAIPIDPFGVMTDRFKEYGRDLALVSPAKTGEHDVPRTLVGSFVFAHNVSQVGTIESCKVLEGPGLSADFALAAPPDLPRFLISHYFETLNAEARGDETRPLWLVNDDVRLVMCMSQGEMDISDTPQSTRAIIWQALVKKKTNDNPTSLSDCLDALDALKDLKDGWNSYSAPAPNPVAIENAKALVKETERLGTTPERVEPSAMGGVGVTFASGHREIVIEFYNRGTAHALFSDDATGDMQTQAVSTDRDGYRRVIGEVRKYLYGE